jgi:vacuolar-type H+-ATPase subunit E/Vma4
VTRTAQEIIMATKLQLLQDHCQTFERALQGCDSEPQAEQLREQICNQLGDRCKSEMMQEMLSEHARELIRRHFSPAPDQTASAST